MENQKTIQQTDEMEIDLLELLAALRRKLWLILLAAVIGGGIAGAFSKFVRSTRQVYEPVYAGHDIIGARRFTSAPPPRKKRRRRQPTCNAVRNALCNV